jgi:phage terminase large subunit-like protein
VASWRTWSGSWYCTSRRSCPLLLLFRLRRRKWKQRKKNLRSLEITSHFFLTKPLNLFCNMINKMLNTAKKKEKEKEKWGENIFSTDTEAIYFFK